MNSNLSAELNSPFRSYKAINQGIKCGLVKSRDMSKVTLSAESRPSFRPVLRNHWACYMTGDDEITELSFHVDGISIKIWGKDLNGNAVVKEAHNLGYDMNLVWRRFEYDVKFGRARLSDDSASFNRYIADFSHGKPARILARKDGISLMVKWLRRQERFIRLQEDRITAELKEMGKAMGKGAEIGYANYSEDDAPHVIEKRVAKANVAMLNATFNAVIRRGCSMPECKVNMVLEAPPTALLTKQSSLQKLEGGYSAGVGNRGQIDSYRVAPRNRKQEAYAILADMAQRQFNRAEQALLAGNLEESDALFTAAAETEAKANALKSSQAK